VTFFAPEQIGQTQVTRLVSAMVSGSTDHGLMLTSGALDSGVFPRAALGAVCISTRRSSIVWRARTYCSFATVASVTQRANAAREIR